MNVLGNNEMIDAMIKAEKEDALSKRFAIVSFATKEDSTHIQRCEVISFNNEEIVIKRFSGESSGKIFRKCNFDNRFYSEFDERKWALCLSLIEANDIAKDHSQTNRYMSKLSDKMKFLTEDELQPIAMYIESCMERRKCE